MSPGLEEGPEPVNLMWPIPGAHVITVQDATGAEKPAVLLSWEEAKLLEKLFTPPKGTVCPHPRVTCLPCGLREELHAMIRLRGPRA